MLSQKSNKVNLKDVGIAAIFTILLIGMGITQTGLKENPQKVMIGFGAILLILKILKEESPDTKLDDIYYAGEYKSQQLVEEQIQHIELVFRSSVKAATT